MICGNNGMFLGSRVVDMGIPTDGLIAFYPINNDVLDYSGNGYDGTNLGATFDDDRFLRANKSLNYLDDGNDAKIILPNNLAFDIGTDGTFFCYAKINGAPTNYHSLWSITDTNNSAIQVYVTSANIIGIYNGSSSKFSNYQITTGNWESLAFVLKTNDSVDLYVNGVFEENMTNTGLVNLTDIESNVLGAWGADQSNMNQDTIAMYNRNLTSAEILQLHNYSK